MNFIIKGNICYSTSISELSINEDSYLVCENGLSRGAFKSLPERYSSFVVHDYTGCIVIPGLCDLHIHAPQYSYRGLGMDLELLDWLKTYTFPEESRFADLSYAEKAYEHFVSDLISGATTRAVIFATIHVPATVLLMEKLESSGLVSLVGKVNMDRNSPESLCEKSAVESYNNTLHWLEEIKGRFSSTYPIITPRFIPTCSDELMAKLGELQKQYVLPVQSHLSENLSEIEWVKELCPGVDSYGEAYARFGLFGLSPAPTVMAHCVWSDEKEEKLIKENGVYVAHCPQSNMNICSGIAPIRRYLENGVKVGLGTDVAGGAHTSVFRAMSDAVIASKLYWRLIDQSYAPLTVPEVFYLGTLGGGEVFGKVGSFDDGYEFDAVIIDDSELLQNKDFTVGDRLERIICLSTDVKICGKYVRGRSII